MADGAPEHFEKWWQGIKLGGFMNDEIMPDHVRQAFDLGVLFEREACAKVADESAADHDEDTPGGFCAANAARHAAKKIRERK